MTNQKICYQQWSAISGSNLADICFLFTIVIILFFFCDPCRQLSLLVIPVVRPQADSPILISLATIRGDWSWAALTNASVYKELRLEELKDNYHAYYRNVGHVSPAADNSSTWSQRALSQRLAGSKNSNDHRTVKKPFLTWSPRVNQVGSTTLKHNQRASAIHHWRNRLVEGRDRRGLHRRSALILEWNLCSRRGSLSVFLTRQMSSFIPQET